MQTTKTFLLVLLTLSVSHVFAEWKPIGNKIKTQWADEVNPSNALPEYPRPIMERAQWLNLNGLWNYAITKKDAPLPNNFDGKILVPFCVESSLSGVGKTISGDNSLWYERTLEIPADWKGKNILLNFGAVDWKAEVFIDNNKIGEHTGGYTPFSFDITKYIKGGKCNLSVRVWDNTSTGIPRGKQHSKPRGIFYTAVSGIWQTVWIEPVSATHITNIKTTPNLDASSFDICAFSNDKDAIAEIKVLDAGKVVATNKAKANNLATVFIENPKLWSPDSPFLYDIEINLSKGGNVVDTIKSYAAMRKFEIMAASKFGRAAFKLNNKKIFTFATLDQGWWPDGLYTAPTDKALLFDVERTKALGFNSIRKHVKVEPARWYTHCDRTGIIVWQDMPSIFFNNSNEWQPHCFFAGKEKSPTEDIENTYRKEWKEIIDYLYSYPCIAIWVPFNEAWGQFKTREITAWTKNYDPSRLVNSASGGNFFSDCGDIVDSHSYPKPEIIIFDASRINVVGEYGGLGIAIKNHLWAEDKKNWGYGGLKTVENATQEFISYTQELIELAKRGYSGAVYTQITDVEGEVNGLFTYDRKVLKYDEAKIREANLKLSNFAF